MVMSGKMSMIREVLAEVAIVAWYGLIGSMFIKWMIDNYHKGWYYMAGLDFFGAFYNMVLLMKFVLR